LTADCDFIDTILSNETASTGSDVAGESANAGGAEGGTTNAVSDWKNSTDLKKKSLKGGTTDIVRRAGAGEECATARLKNPGGIHITTQILIGKGLHHGRSTRGNWEGLKESLRKILMNHRGRKSNGTKGSRAFMQPKRKDDKKIDEQDGGCTLEKVGNHHTLTKRVHKRKAPLTSHDKW